MRSSAHTLRVQILDREGSDICVILYSFHVTSVRVFSASIGTTREVNFGSDWNRREQEERIN